MTTRGGAVLAVLLALVVTGCGTSTQTSTPGPSARATTSSPSAAPPTSPSPALEPTIPIGTALAVGVPDGWVVARSAVVQGSGSVCLEPQGSTEMVFGCAGVAFDFGPHLPGAHLDPYAADRPDGWYPSNDRHPCPFVNHDLNDAKIVPIRRMPGVERGLKPVGAHRARWNRWTATCAARTFHPQAWFLPTSKVVVFDYLDHPETASILASAVFARDGATLPAAPSYLSAHVVSGTGSKLLVQPFHTYTNDAEAKAYAAAHGLEFPFLNDYLDADVGPRRTVVLDARTACLGGLGLGQASLTGMPVPCSAFGAYRGRLPVGIWLRPGSSTAASVTEIFRP